MTQRRRPPYRLMPAGLAADRHTSTRDDQSSTNALILAIRDGSRHEQDCAMENEFERVKDADREALDISGAELADLLDCGLDPTEIDRLRFTRWRLRTNQLQGDGWPHHSGQAKRPRPRMRSAGRPGSS